MWTLINNYEYGYETYQFPTFIRSVDIYAIKEFTQNSINNPIIGGV
jgi:hypothetical protein